MHTQLQLSYANIAKDPKMFLILRGLIAFWCAQAQAYHPYKLDFFGHGVHRTAHFPP